MKNSAFSLPPEKLQQFAKDGYFVLEDAIDPSTLAMLRDECTYFVAREDAKMDALGVDVLDITHRNKRYHASFCIRDRPGLGQFVFGPVMEEICRKLVGPNVYLFYDQFVVKGAEAGMKLAWHQDSGYVNAVDGDVSHHPYITCWCPLDDVTEENGTLTAQHECFPRNALPFTRVFWKHREGSWERSVRRRMRSSNARIDGYLSSRSGSPSCTCQAERIPSGDSSNLR